MNKIVNASLHTVEWLLSRIAPSVAIMFPATSFFLCCMRAAARWLAGILAACFVAASAYAANTIQLENAKPGTASWHLFKPAVNREIEGYASLTSVNRGQSIDLFVSTASPSYTIDIYRIGWYNGAGGRHLLGPVTRPGTLQPMPAADSDGMRECAWSDPYTLDIPDNVADPTDWASGVYVAKLTASADGAQNYIMFTVRDDNRTAAADYLFQSSVNTWQAYNNWGGQSLYDTNSVAALPAHKVSFNRPYAGDGSGDFFNWEVYMVRFLEREGYDVSYVTNVDLHEQGDALIAPHRAFLSVGHDEYWSYQMKSAIQSARDQGRNVGFFGADAIYWQVRYEPSVLAPEAANRTLVGYKEAALTKDPYWLGGDPSQTKFVTTLFRNLASAPYNVVDPVAQPENGVVGVMYHGSPVDSDIVVSDASSWIFDGTGVSNGYHFVGLLGYEADSMADNGFAPAGLHKLAESPDPFGVSHMTTYTAPGGATVFASGSIQWVWGLDDYEVWCGASVLDPNAQQATRNILARFTSTPVAPPAMGVPVNPIARCGNAQAIVSFGAAPTEHGTSITGYTVTSNPGGGIDNDAGTTALSHLITGLANGVNYTFTVTATDSGGGSATSRATNTVRPASPPGSPTDPLAAAGDGAATVSFSAPADDGGSRVSGYTVISDPPGGADINAGSTVLSHLVTGLTNGVSYTFSVTAKNSMGISDPSGTSNSVTPLGVPGRPTNVQATVDELAATVTFDAPSSNGGTAISGYTVVSNPAGAVDTDAGSASLSHLIVGLTGGTAYTFTVIATSSQGGGAPSNPSNSVWPATSLANGVAVADLACDFGCRRMFKFAVPAGVSNLSFAASGGSGGDLDIFVKFAGLPTLALYDAKSDGATRNETIAIPAPQAGTYYLLVYADWSNYSGVTLLASYGPGVPTGVVAATGNTQATVGFNAPANDGGSAIAGYTVLSNPPGGIDTNAGSTALSHLVTGLANGTAYSFTVTASNALASSAPSNASNTITPYAPAPPAAPTIGTVVAGNGSVSVSFAAGALGTGSFIRHTADCGGTTATGSASPILVGGLTNGLAVTCRVRTTSSDGDGAWSGPSNSVTPATAPGMPTAVVASRGNGQASVSFSAPASDGGSAIQGYTVVSTPPGGTDGDAGSSALTHVVTGLANGSAYTFTGRAANAVGPGASSDPSNSVTPAGPPGIPTGVVAVAGNAQASVTFGAAANNGDPITGYAVFSNPPGGIDGNAGSTSLTHVVTGLMNGTSYSFTVVATNSAGGSAPSGASNSVTPATFPSASTMGASNVSATGATLNGSVNANGASTDVTFDVGASIAYGTHLAAVPATFAPRAFGSVALTLSVLNCNATYHFRVNAVNSVGASSGGDQSFKTAACSGTVPGAPRISAATAGPGRATVSFVPPADNGGNPILGYTATCTAPGHVARSMAGASSPVTVLGLVGNVVYFCYVVATNGVGDSPPSASLSVTAGKAINLAPALLLLLD